MAHAERGPRTAWPGPFERCRPPAEQPVDQPSWSLSYTKGRLCEASGDAVLTASFALVRDTQRRGDAAAWISARGDGFHPPDVARCGIDLRALPFVKASGFTEAAGAAEELVRSGGFGLVVVDAPQGGHLRTASQGRLVKVAQHHGAAVVFLTSSPLDGPSVGSLVSLRMAARLSLTGDGAGVVLLEALKDKRRGPGWRASIDVMAPPGLS